MCKVTEWKEKIPYDALIDCIDQLSDWGVPKLTIGGGEPLLFTDELLRILEHAQKRGILTHFSTNGTNFDRQFLRAYSKMGGGQVSVSLDGATKETHDLSRNYEGAFEIAMNAIETFKSIRPKNVILKIQPVLKNDNVNEIIDVFEIAKECNALFSIQAYDPMDFEILRQEVALSEIRKKYPLWVGQENIATLKKTIESLIELKRKYPGTILNTTEYLRDVILYFERKLDFRGKCLVGYTSLFINPDGHVSMCLYGNIGNIADCSLKELWTSATFEKIRKRMIACDRPCLNGCAQRYTSGKIIYEGFNYLKRRLLG